MSTFGGSKPRARWSASTLSKKPSGTIPDALPFAADAVVDFATPFCAVLATGSWTVGALVGVC